MTGYRVAEEVEDPLATDPALAASQKLKDGLTIHGIVTVATLGLWLPVLALWLLFRKKGPLEGYAVQLRGGVLRFGTRDTSSAIPLETITGVHVQSGRLRLQVQGGRNQPTTIQVDGLVDPAAAADAILDARREHVAGLGRVRVDIEDEREPEPSEVPREGAERARR